MSLATLLRRAPKVACPKCGAMVKEAELERRKARHLKIGQMLGLPDDWPAGCIDSARADMSTGCGCCGATLRGSTE